MIVVDDALAIQVCERCRAVWPPYVGVVVSHFIWYLHLNVSFKMAVAVSIRRNAAAKYLIVPHRSVVLDVIGNNFDIVRMRCLDARVAGIMLTMSM